MKSIFTFLLITLFICNSYAQFGPQQIISNQIQNPYMSLPFDIDNDGFIDVLSVHAQNSTMKWNGNLDGEGIFGDDIVITQEPALYLLINFVDLDSDGDNDLVYLENNPRELRWMENLDGEGNFENSELIYVPSTNYIEHFAFLDFDNDTDLDILVSETGLIDTTLNWLENSGEGNFNTPQFLLETTPFDTEFKLADLDNDGNTDLLWAHNNGPAKLIWFKNTGNSLFGPEQLIYQFDFIQSGWTSINDIQLVDINTDGKKDIVITSYNEDNPNPESHTWFENLDNEGNFGEEHFLGYNGKFFDVDNDGDNDIIKGYFYGARISWIENIDGLGTFENERTITTDIDFLRDFQIADFNGDDLIDIVSASSGDNKIAWYENTGILNVSEHNLAPFFVYPNPVNETLFIESEATIKSMSLFTILGQEVLNTEAASFISMKNLSKGIYFLKVNFEDGSSISKKIVKN